MININAVKIMLVCFSLVTLNFKYIIKAIILMLLKFFCSQSQLYKTNPTFSRSIMTFICDIMNIVLIKFHCYTGGRRKKADFDGKVVLKLETKSNNLM
jgi:hypothetical protein